MKLAVLAVLIGSTAFAENFDGTWKVPEAQMQNPGACKKGDQKECLRLAWTAEAGIRGAGEDDAKRLTKAKEWHAKACAIAKQSPCANADRVQKKLDAAAALKTDAERATSWCGDALEGAARFEAGSKTAPVVVASACKKLFPAKFQKALGAVAGVDADMKSAMLVVAAQEELCPTLKTKPAVCKNRKASQGSVEERRKALGEIFKAALTGDAAARADDLATWFST